MKNTKQIGLEAEEFVAQKLVQQGFIIVERNYKKMFGEIDVIARKKDLFVFVEVKMRTRAQFDPTLVIIPSKQKKIIMVAKEFIVTHDIHDKLCRFDVAIVQLQESEFQLLYIPNAFTDEE